MTYPSIWSLEELQDLEDHLTMEHFRRPPRGTVTDAVTVDEVVEDRPLPSVVVGQCIYLKMYNLRTDGLVDKQHIMARVTKVVDDQVSWSIAQTIFEENVLRKAESGGFRLQDELTLGIRGIFLNLDDWMASFPRPQIKCGPIGGDRIIEVV